MIQADANGHIVGKFTIPADVPAGTKLVEFDGALTEAAATFIGQGTLEVTDLQMVNTSVIHREAVPVDPVAQTFIFPARDGGSNQQVAAVDLWFTAIGSSPILVNIRETTAGFPNQTIVAESVMTPGEINVGAWTRFRFSPTTLEPNREYAIVVMCNDASARVALAEVGQFAEHVQQWVTSQPYQVGVLLSSSNASTWTAHQTQDLTFRLLTCDYDAGVNEIREGSPFLTVPLDPVTVTDADHLIVLATVQRPTPECNVIFRLSVDGNVYEVMEYQPFTLPERFSGVITWEAELSGTFRASPVLDGNIALVEATRLADSDYVTRVIQANSGTKVTLYYDVILPGASSVDAYMEDGADNWRLLPIVAGTELGDGVQEVKRELTDLGDVETRIKLVLHGTAQAQPTVYNLRAAIT